MSHPVRTGSPPAGEAFDETEHGKSSDRTRRDRRAENAFSPAVRPTRAAKDLVEWFGTRAMFGSPTASLSSAGCGRGETASRRWPMGLCHVARSSFQGNEPVVARWCRMKEERTRTGRLGSGAAGRAELDLPLTVNAVMPPAEPAYSFRHHPDGGRSRLPTGLEVAKVQYYGWALKNRAALDAHEAADPRRPARLVGRKRKCG